MFGLLGFLPAYLVTRVQSSLGILRIPETIELKGLDFVDNLSRELAKEHLVAIEKERSAQDQTRS